MATTVAPRDDQTRPAAEDALVHELERLWDAPAAGVGQPRAPAAPRGRRDAYELLRAALVWGWPTFLVSLLLFTPAPEAGAITPGWVDLASVAILLGVPAAAFMARVLPRGSLAVSGVLGGLGIAVGIACRATEHHLGAWWLVETTGFAALAALSVACLALRSSR
jgi:hypothetical protein